MPEFKDLIQPSPNVPYHMGYNISFIESVVFKHPKFESKHHNKSFFLLFLGERGDMLTKKNIGSFPITGKDGLKYTIEYVIIYIFN